MKDILLKNISKILTPFIVLFAIYIQLNAENSPGGGFQAGAILASAFILYSMAVSHETLLKLFSKRFLELCASIGLLIYVATGLFTLLSGYNFLDYIAFPGETIADKQKLGIFIIEIGIAMCVFGSILLIYYRLYSLSLIK